VDKAVETVGKSARGQQLREVPEPPRRALGIFAKEPVPGRVKTRLCPPLSPEEAAEIYRISLEETVAVASSGRFFPVIFYTGRQAYFRQAFPGLTLIAQVGDDLGERMDRALETLLGQGHAAAVLIGSDSPDLPPAHLEDAFALLDRADCVTVPADDGGYVLIGERRHHPELFRDIPWSTGEVLAATRRRAAALGIDYRELAPWEDVDDLESLKRLLQRSPGSATAAFARAQLGHRL